MKRSLIRLEPTGFEFEKFVAEKDDRKYLVEWKFHSILAYTGLKEVMYTYAHFP